jgi:hypothetical protein
MEYIVANLDWLQDRLKPLHDKSVPDHAVNRAIFKPIKPFVECFHSAAQICSVRLPGPSRVVHASRGNGHPDRVARRTPQTLNRLCLFLSFSAKIGNLHVSCDVLRPCLL